MTARTAIAQRRAIVHLTSGGGGHILLSPQQHGDPYRCGKQDELLAQGIEPAVIVVDGVDRVGGMALIDRESRDHISVRAAILPPRRQVEGCIAVEPQKDRPSDKKDAKAKTVSHAAPSFCLLSLRNFIRDRASMIMSGRATAPTVICESATSGA